jgi:hypothetical protein
MPLKKIKGDRTTVSQKLVWIPKARPVKYNARTEEIWGPRDMPTRARERSPNLLRSAILSRKCFMASPQGILFSNEPIRPIKRGQRVRMKAIMKMQSTPISPAKAQLSSLVQTKSRSTSQARPNPIKANNTRAISPSRRS